MITPDQGITTVEPGYRGFLRFCDLVGFGLQPYMRRIAKACFGPARQIVIVLPKGNFKTTICSLIGLHHLLCRPDAEVRIGAGVRAQAEICLKRMKFFARHEAICDRLTITYFELRDELGGDLTVLSGAGERLHGTSPTLLIADEVWSWKDAAEMLEAMESSLLKRTDSKLILISTAAPSLDGPLGRLRRRAMAQKHVSRVGVVTESVGDDLHWLEWSIADDEDTADLRLVKRCNPAGYITVAALRKQRLALRDAAFKQFHCNVWGIAEGQWLPPAAWSACVGDWAPPDAPVVLGVDIGGSRSTSALVGVTTDLQVAEVHVYAGDEAVLKIVDAIVEVASRRSIIELAHDPWRFTSEAVRLQRDHRLPVVAFPMSASRMGQMSETLHSAIVSGRLTHPNHPILNRHAANAIAVEAPRGWRLAKPADDAPIDALVALGEAVERVEQRPQKREPRFLEIL